MKKDKDWLNEQVGELNITDAVFNESGVSYIDTAVSIERVYELINQLDEPEVTELDALNRLAQNMPFSADEIASHLEKLSAYNGHGIKLVPKQEEPNDDLYILMLNGGFVTGFELEAGRVVGLERQSDYDASVVMGTRPFMEFIQKQVGGELHNITNPEEPKYRVVIGNYVLRKWNNSNTFQMVVKGSPEAGNLSGCKTDLTESEIKAIDKRFWAFAEPVEEEEE